MAEKTYLNGSPETLEAETVTLIYRGTGGREYFRSYVERGKHYVAKPNQEIQVLKGDAIRYLELWKHRKPLFELVEPKKQEAMPLAEKPKAESELNYELVTETLAEIEPETEKPKRRGRKPKAESDSE